MFKGKAHALGEFNYIISVFNSDSKQYLVLEHLDKLVSEVAMIKYQVLSIGMINFVMEVDNKDLHRLVINTNKVFEKITLINIKD